MTKLGACILLIILMRGKAPLVEVHQVENSIVLNYDTLTCNGCRIIYPIPPFSYELTWPMRDRKDVTNRYENDTLNINGDAFFYSLRLRLDVLGVVVPHSYSCRGPGMEWLEIEKSVYHSRSRYWDFYYNKDEFRSYLVFNDSINVDFRTNDPRVREWFFKTRDSFIIEVHQK